MANVDAELGQQVLYVPQAQWEMHIHEDNEADDLARGVEISERAWDFALDLRLIGGR